MQGLTGLLFLGAHLHFGYGYDFTAIAVSTSMLLTVGIVDFDHQRILNRSLIPAYAIALLLAPFWTEAGLDRTFLGHDGLLASFLNSAVAGGGTFLVFLTILMLFPRRFGEGDVKLGLLIGLLAGVPGAVFGVWLSFLAAGAVAIILVVTGRMGRKDTMPLGPFLAAGTIVAL